MAISGSAQVIGTTGASRALKEGELLAEGDTVTVPSGARVVLGFDKEWKNVTVIKEDSKVQIRSVHPTDLKMEYGDLLMKLDQLPNESTFEVETPVAVTAVRGSLFETIHRNGQTFALNFEDSEVFLFVLDLIS